jgi:hypothetical protein
MKWLKMMLRYRSRSSCSNTCSSKYRSGTAYESPADFGAFGPIPVVLFDRNSPFAMPSTFSTNEKGSRHVSQRQILFLLKLKHGREIGQGMRKRHLMSISTSSWSDHAILHPRYAGTS